MESPDEFLIRTDVQTFYQRNVFLSDMVVWIISISHVENIENPFILFQSDISRKRLELRGNEIVAETDGDGGEMEAPFLRVVRCFDVRLVVEVVRYCTAEENGDQTDGQYESSEPDVFPGTLK